MAAPKINSKAQPTIEWLCATPAKRLQDLQQSNLASVRLRTAVGIQAGNALGLRHLLSDGRTNFPAQMAVVGKIDYVSDPARPARWLQRLKDLKTRGASVMIDYTDHHLSGQTPAAAFYRDALPLADTILASSARLGEYLLQHTGRKAVILDDPIEVSLQSPRARNNPIKTILWFGHASNLPYLFDYLLTRYRANGKHRLIMMTNLHPLPDQYVQALNAPHLAALDIHVIPWSISDMLTASRLSDLCIIPAGVADPRKSGASANRLLTALALGLPTAADPLDSYMPFANSFIDLQQADLDSMLETPELHFPSVIEAQQLIANQHTMVAAQMRWQQVLASAQRHGIAV